MCGVANGRQFRRARRGLCSRALRRTKTPKVSRHGQKLVEGNAEWVAWSGVHGTGRPVEALANHLTLHDTSTWTLTQHQDAQWQKCTTCSLRGQVLIIAEKGKPDHISRCLYIDLYQ